MVVAAIGGSITDKVAKVLAAMAAGGGAAVTNGPPETTGEATAFVACVVAIAVAEVDAVIGATVTAGIAVTEVVSATGVAITFDWSGATVFVCAVVRVSKTLFTVGCPPLSD